MVLGSDTLSEPVKISLLQPIGAMQLALADPFSFPSDPLDQEVLFELALFFQLADE
jgi:hypothetical protein